MSRKVVVLKFGSSVLQSPADLPKAVHEIYRWVRRQYRVLAVVSAFAGETDRLLGTVESYRDANPEAIARIVATGEEVATAFLALELDRFGIPAQVLDASQIQLIAETTSNDTKPVSANILAIENVLQSGRVAIIPGFVARDRLGRVALFGRGGSDLSALFLARQLGARCRLIKDVDGIYDSDPAKSPAAQRFHQISFADALALGGKIVQPKAIVFGRNAGIRFEVAALAQNYATTVGAPRSLLTRKNSSPTPLKIGLLGLGTVGLGVFQELSNHPDLFEVAGIAVRRPELHRDHAPTHLLTRDCWEATDGVDVVVELIGGIDPAGDLVKAALASGKSVVTANKLLLAADISLESHRHLRYSAAVGGAVPALEAISALAARGESWGFEGARLKPCRKPPNIDGALAPAGTSLANPHFHHTPLAAHNSKTGVPSAPAVGAMGWKTGVRSAPAVGAMGWKTGVPGAPAVGALGWKAGHIVSFSGVLNGTCNYILDRIAAGCSWEQALAEAQANGFAEQDPRADISGSDTVCKLRLLARRAFPEADAHYLSATGIDAIDPDWVQSAARRGGRVRLVGTAQLAAGTVHLEVKPTLVDASHPFAQIRNEENCLLIETAEPDAQHIWTGRGAGRWPTTAAVMADLFDLSRQLRAASYEIQARGAEPRTASSGFGGQREKSEFLEPSAPLSLDLPDPRRPSVSPFLSAPHTPQPSRLAGELSRLTTDNRQLTTDSDHWPLATDSGGAA